MKPIKDQLTIIIPVKNEEKYISSLLTDLRYQIGIQGVRIIVADGGSTDSTFKILIELKDLYSPYINIEIIEGGSVSRGRNAGLEITQTPYVLFIDADVRLTDTSQVEETLKGLNHKKLVGAHVRCKGSLMASLSYTLFNSFNRGMCKFRPFALGSYFGARVLDLKKFGGWDETLVHSEDWDLSGKYKPKDFVFSRYPIEVDDRRFRKMGYFGMLVILLKSAILGKKYQRKDNGYWS